MLPCPVFLVALSSVVVNLAGTVQCTDIAATSTLMSLACVCFIQDTGGRKKLISSLR